MKLVIRRAAIVRLPVQRLQTLLRSTLRRHPRAARELVERAPQGELSLVILGEAAMRKLNRQHRKQDRSTDVLSFDYGELFICAPVAKRQAKEHGVAIANELSLLFVHGLLHILGFDHERPADLKRMARAEAEVLGWSGLITRAHQL